MGISAFLGSLVIPALIGGGAAFSGYNTVDTIESAKEEKKKAKADADKASYDQQKQANDKKFLDEELIRRDVARSVQKGQGASASGRAGTILTGNLGGVSDQTALTDKKQIGK